VKRSERSVFNCSPDFFGVNLGFEGQVEGQVDDLIVVQMGECLDQSLLDFLGGSSGALCKNLFHGHVVGHLNGREEVVGNESFTSSDLGPVLVGF